MTPPAYLEDPAPGSGARSAPRARLSGDAPSLDLSGTWRFRLSPHADPDGEPWLDDHDTSDGAGWADLPVPSHWVLHGDGAYGRPAYTNVVFPVPVDPPHVPDENPTGDHRRVFDLPPAFEGAERVLLRLDGVESAHRVWLNGSDIGTGTGSRLVQEYDVTDALRTGTNVLLVRVHQWSAATYLEDQDQWWLPGIFREVTLLARPAGALDDVWVQAGFDHATGRGALRLEVSAAEAAWPVVLRVPGLDLERSFASADDLAAAGALDVGTVEPWSAESPRLYDVEVASAGETVRLRTGFRTVVVAGDRLLVNGAPLVFHGVNRHEVDADEGRVFDAARAREDLLLMKRHNVDAIRTSHYPPHPGVLDLADELGFWVVDECDLETHGFEPLGWRDNPSDDLRWREAYLDRIRRTVERDKNHPSVVMWSLGNEAGTGRNLAAMSAWVHDRDPSRPVHYEGDHTGEYTDVYSRMYPAPEEVATVCADSGPVRWTTPAQAVRVRDQPFVMCEYLHAMGNGPGAIQEYTRLVEASPRSAGGFVWEWKDHGLRTTTADGTEFFAYGGDFGEVVHDGNFVMDGLVLSDGTPSPGLLELAHAFAAVRADVVPAGDPSGGPSGDQSVDPAGGPPRLRVRNARHSTSTADLEVRWLVEVDGVAVADGTADVPDVPAGTQLDVALPDALVQALGTARATAGAGAGATAGDEVWVTTSVVQAAATAWAPQGHVVRASQWDASASPLLGAAAGGTAATAATGAPGQTGATGEVAAGPSDRGPRASVLVPRRGTAVPVVVDGVVTLGPARLDARTGRLLELGALAVDGPLVELWRAPTDNDRGSAPYGYELADPVLTGGLGDPDAPSSESLWRAAGLDRLVHRTVSVDVLGDRVVVRRRTGSATTSLGAETVLTYLADGEELVLRADVRAVGGWRTTWPRVGVRLDLPLDLVHARWFGPGPHESYADSCAATRVGVHASAVEDLVVAYARPQESGHRPDTRWLELDPSGDGPGLSVRSLTGDAGGASTGGRVGFTARRHTAQQVDAAAHPHELPAPRALHLYLDAAQHGLGSRACGPDVRPEHALWPGTHRIAVALRAR